jgi:hypothetical protein
MINLLRGCRVAPTNLKPETGRERNPKPAVQTKLFHTRADNMHPFHDLGHPNRALHGRWSENSPPVRVQATGTTPQLRPQHETGERSQITAASTLTTHQETPTPHLLTAPQQAGSTLDPRLITSPTPRSEDPVLPCATDPSIRRDQGKHSTFQRPIHPTPTPPL